MTCSGLQDPKGEELGLSTSDSRSDGLRGSISQSSSRILLGKPREAAAWCSRTYPRESARDSAYYKVPLLTYIDHQILLLRHTLCGSLVGNLALHIAFQSIILSPHFEGVFTHDLWSPYDSATPMTTPNQYLTSLTSEGPPRQKLIRNSD